MRDEFAVLFQKHTDNNPKTKDDEYMQDGLKYCEKCNQARQCEIQYGGKQYLMKCLCKCESEQYDEAEKKRESEKLQKELMQNIKGAKYREMTFENSDKEIAFAREYVENFDTYLKDNAGLMIIGSVGTGKTYAAACIANALIKKGISVLMANITYFTNAISEFDNGKIIADLENFALVVIDDVGAEANTEFVKKKVYQIIETRDIANKPLIITSNITMDELKDSTSPNFRTYDRLKKLCHPIIMTGESRRVQMANDRFAHLKEKLKY